MIIIRAVPKKVTIKNPQQYSREETIAFLDNIIFLPSVDLPTRFCVLYASTGAFYCTAKGVTLGQKCA